MAHSASRFLILIARFCLGALAVIVPLTLFPWTVDTLEINKQTLGVLFVVVAAVCWLGNMLLEKRADLRLSWVYAPLGAFFLFTCVSAALSLAPYTSVVGQSGQEYTSLLSLVVFSLFFLTGAHIFTGRRFQRNMWSVFLVSTAIIS